MPIRSFRGALSGRVFPALFSAILILGCAESGTRDVAGALDSITPLPFVEFAHIGGSNAAGAAAFGSVSAVGLASERDLLTVADGTTQLFHQFAIDGKHVRTFGGRGSGPGEARAVREVWSAPSGDLCVWDVQLLRITRFDSVGTVVSTGVVAPGDFARIRPGFVGFLDTCAVVLADRVLARRARREQEAYVQDTLQYILYRHDGQRVRPLSSQAEVPQWWRRAEDGNGMAFDLVFGPRLFAVVRLDELWIGVSDSLRWQRFDTAAPAKMEAFRLPARIRAATSRDVERERERLSDSLPLPNYLQGPAFERLNAHYQAMTREQLPARNVLPAYDRLLAGVDGSLWIRETPLASESSARWLLVNGSGTIQGYLRMPREASLEAGTEKLAVFVTRDEFDAQLVRIWIRKGLRDGDTAADQD